MKKFDIIELRWYATRKPKKGELSEIASNDTEWQTIKSFNTIEEAKEELTNYKSYFHKTMEYAGITHYDVIAYAIEEIYLDEDGEPDSSFISIYSDEEEYLWEDEEE